MTDQKLNVVMTGTGEPTLVFVHGFCCSLDDWKAQIDALSSTFKCVALDLPGHGSSSVPSEITLAELGAAVNSAKARSAGRQFILIGHSLGCKIIREAYAQSSEDVVGMVFIEGAFYPGDPGTVSAKARDAVDNAGFAAYARCHFSEMFVDSSDPGLRESILARIGQVNPDFGRALYLQAVGWDAIRGRQTLHSIKVPVLVLQSSYMDAELKRRPLLPGIQTPFMKLVTELVPSAEVKVIPGCGHFVMNEAPDAVNKELLSFATRISRNTP
jgi:pimeloyl-ACP methyl ester carboxylesterase